MHSAAPVTEAATGRPHRQVQPPEGLRHLWRWVPICALGERDRPAIEVHLLQLSARDRYLRFGYPATDERIRAHVAQIDFQGHEHFGIYNRRLELVATAHLAYADEGRHMAEFAVSVLQRARGRHYGKRLFQHAVRHCRNGRVGELFIHALTENTAMLRIVKRAGAKVRHHGGESEAWLELPPDSLGSHVGELVDSRAAALNLMVKLQPHYLAWAVRLLRSAKARLLDRA